ncbi:PcfJ domain-containing protein [uncultured Flavobacterium sp.]|uniref:PcfJ domain-containing protein n=1 Tax=uncultured Flavobacterium sp. TaxID=165435 RepID=UPI0025FE77F9|nr:PcfJ domain-containing protein [uncultured Flavobacterium sp.]
MYWYIQLGRGDSVLALSGFPVKFRNSMAHAFRLTPPICTVAQAIRRAQALGYGATPERASLITWSALTDGFENEMFWKKVILFIAQVKEEMGLDKLQVVLEYLESLRVEQPEMNMKGRTWKALLSQAEVWKIEKARRLEAKGYMEWKCADIIDFYKQEENVIYKTVQLTSSEALYEEGYEMHHCVADYTDDCAVGDAAIFSLREYKTDDPQANFTRIATIDVCLQTNEITEAKGKYNEMPDQKTDDLIKEWAETAKLTVAYEFDDGFYDLPMAAAQEVREGESPETWGIIIMGIIMIIIKMIIFSS